MADDGQTAEILDEKDLVEPAATPLGDGQADRPKEDFSGVQERGDDSTETPFSDESGSDESDTNSGGEEKVLDADDMLSHSQAELMRIYAIGEHFANLVESPSQDRVEKLDSELDKLRTQAEKILQNKNIEEKAINAVRIRGEGAVEILKNSIAQNSEEGQEESAQNAAYSALVNIVQDIKKTLKENYAPENQPFPLTEDNDFPVGDILSALALHVYEDGNVQHVEDLAVLGNAAEIETTTENVIAVYESALTDEENKASKKLANTREKIAQKEQERQATEPNIAEEKAQFLREHPQLKAKLQTLQQYHQALNATLETPSAEAYFAGNEDVLAIFNHMDSELGDDADAIALKRNDDRKRYFITLKNLDEEHFDELVREAQQDISSLADLIDQERKAVSQNYIPAVETLDKLAKSVKPNTTAPEQAAESADTDEADGEADTQEEMAPVNYTSFAQYKQRADQAITALTNSLKSKEHSEYEAFLAAVEERGTEDATEEQLEAIKTHGENLLQSATEADAKLAQKRPDNTPMLRRANIMGAALAFADEADADNHFKNPENSKIIDVLNKKIESTDSDEQKGEYESLKKMMVAASSVDAYQAEKGSPISIMQNLRDDVDALRAKAEENGEDADVTDEKIVDAVRSHMDTMVDIYLPSEKQLKNAQKTSYFRALTSRIQSLVQRVTGTRDQVKKERIEPTISDEQMNAAIDKLVEPESDDLPEESADDHDDLLFADEEDDRLEPEDDQDLSATDKASEEKIDEPEQPDLPFEGEEQATSENELDSEEPVDAEFDESGTGKPMRKDDDQEPVDAEFEEVEKAKGHDRDDEPEIETPESKEKPSMLASFAAASTGALATVAVMAATLGLDQEIGTYALGAVGGGVAALALVNGLRNDPTKTILTVGSTVAISMLAKGALLGAAAAIPFVPGIVATMGVFAVASALGGMGATIVGNLLEKARGNDVSLLDGSSKNMLRGAAFGAFAGALGFAFAGDGADNALAGGQNTDLTANGAENAGLSGGEPEQTLAPDPEASIEPGAGVNNGLAGNADLTEVSGPDFGDMSAAEIREAAGVMYTEGDYQGALDALNVALEKAPEWLDESIQGDIANIAMVHGLETGTEGFDSASDMLSSSFREAQDQGHGRTEDYLRMLMEKRDLLSPSGPSMS